MSGYIHLKDQKLLCMRSGNRCAMPECRKKLVINKTPEDKESIIGVMAHIKGEKPTAARFDALLPDPERNCYDNLIFVCGDDHKRIDDQEKTYTVERLHLIKQEHEAWVETTLGKEMVNVTFAELEVITKYLNSNQPCISESYTVIPPKDKIAKNNLSPATERLITMGMLQVRQVAQFIDTCADAEFGERLKEGFVAEYERLKNQEHLSGDELFNSLLSFACGGHKDFKDMAAGLAVVVYLFERCEVFEK